MGQIKTRQSMMGVFFLLMFSVSCGSDTEVSSEAGEACSSASDCSNGEVCRWSEQDKQKVCAKAPTQDVDASVDEGMADVGSDAASGQTCDDQIQNGEETDVDCGGPCGACDAGQGCEEWTDCISGVCSAENTCVLLPFQTVWKTDHEGVSDDRSIQLPLLQDGNYDFTIDWGDQNVESISNVDGPLGVVSHTYASPGTYTVEINGTLEGWSFRKVLNQQNDAPKLVEIKSWGDLRLGNSGGYFSGATNLVITTPDRPNLKGTTSLRGMFRDCISLTTVSAMNRWDVSDVTDMSQMFLGTRKFDQNIRRWNVSRVKDMRQMFDSAWTFNQRLDRWDVSSVTDMRNMFASAWAFNQEIGGWDVSNVTDMAGMFYDARVFNQPIADWNVSKVTKTWRMFESSAFNQDIGGWDVSNVTDMYRMFRSSKFNRNIGGWDVAKVTNMRGMFYGSVFNQDISGWDVSNVTTMEEMFGQAKSFNQNIGGWDVSKVTNMRRMFSGANAFNQGLGGWDISKVETMEGMLSTTSLSTANYDALLNGWASQNVQQGVMFGASAKYSNAAAPARDKLVNTHGWDIFDNGPLF